MDIERLFATPDHFLLRFDGDDAIFVPMDRDTYQRSIFCDQRIVVKAKTLTKIRIDALLEYCASSVSLMQPDGFIFHMAHCGSTLLARGLDITNDNIVCREPFALRQHGIQAATELHPDTSAPQWRRTLRLTLTMLGRRYNRDGPAIVKANVPVNFVIDEILHDAISARAILLYFCLDDYVLAILRSDQHRHWLANIAASVKYGLTRAVDRPDMDIRSLSVAQLAACLWAGQMRMFQDVLTKNAGARSLDAEVFFAEPKNSLRAAFGLFGQEVSESTLDTIVAGDLFNTYSKDPGNSFDNSARLVRRDALRETLADEVAQARLWVETHCGELGQTVLRKPLLKDT